MQCHTRGGGVVKVPKSVTSYLKGPFVIKTNGVLLYVGSTLHFIHPPPQPYQGKKHAKIINICITDFGMLN
jgi:hypothetical protein